jgi:CubicO group peptidase (beta-lactamase class C family)
MRPDRRNPGDADPPEPPGASTMRTFLFVSALAAAFTAAPGALAQNAPATLEERIAHIDAYASRLHALGAFDGLIFIAQGERELLAAGYGLADKEASRPWEVDTVTTVGSITKQFTGAAIMLLAQEGRLDVADTLGKHWPDAPADKASITIHQLLTHSAGFRGGLGPDEQYIGRDDYIKLAWQSELLFAPGERYEYSNVGYSIAAAIVELVSDQPYETFVRERLFLPSGMRDTGYRAPAWAPGRVAVGYRNGQRWGRVLEKQSAEGFSWHLVGNGGIHSTARDMHRWWKSIRDNTILDAAHTERYLAPHQDEGQGDSFYGYGWVNFTAPSGERFLAHNGGNGFYFADCAYFPAQDLFAFIATNDPVAASGDSQLVFEFLAGGSLSLPPDPATVDVAALREAARTRALAWVEAVNAGPEAYVRYGAEHRADRGADEAINAERRRAATELIDQFGRLEVLDDEPGVLGEHRVLVRATKSGQRISVEVKVSPEAPYLVEVIGLNFLPMGE